MSVRINQTVVSSGGGGGTTVTDGAANGTINVDGTPITVYDDTTIAASIAGKANATHSHAQSDVTNLVSDLAGKASSTHNHAQSDITGLATSLSGKANVGDSFTKTESNTNFAVKSSEHSHTNKTVLDKITQSGAEASIDVSSIHTHTNKASLDLVNKDGSNNPTWNGGAWPSSGGLTVDESVVDSGLTVAYDGIKYARRDAHYLEGLVPVMSGATVVDKDGFTITVSSNNNESGYDAWKLFDGSRDTSYRSLSTNTITVTNPQITIDMGRSVYVRGFKMTADRTLANTDNAPFSFKLEGSANGTSWSPTAGTPTGSSTWSMATTQMFDNWYKGETRFFEGAVSSTSYRYYRFTVTNIQNATNFVALSSFNIFGVPQNSEHYNSKVLNLLTANSSGPLYNNNQLQYKLTTGVFDLTVAAGATVTQAFSSITNDGMLQYQVYVLNGTDYELAWSNAAGIKVSQTRASSTMTVKVVNPSASSQTVRIAYMQQT